MNSPLAIIFGASGGIGSELARRLSKNHWKLALVSRNRGPLEALAAELPGASVYSADVTSSAQVQAALDPLSLKVAELELSERRAWRVTLADGATVILGRHFVGERLERFAHRARHRDQGEHARLPTLRRYGHFHLGLQPSHRSLPHRGGEETGRCRQTRRVRSAR